MGTLQTLRGVLRDIGRQEKNVKAQQDAEAMKTEMEALRSRASMLAQNFESTQAELKALLEATDKAFSAESMPTAGSKSASPESARDVLREQLYGGTPKWQDEENYYPGEAPSLFRDKKPPTKNLR